MPPDLKEEVDRNRRVWNTLTAGHTDEERTGISFKPWPVEKITFIRRDREVTVWRNVKTFKFHKKPTLKEMAQWTQVVFP